MSGFTLPAAVARRRHHKPTPNHAECSVVIIIQMWTAVEYNGAIYCTVVTSYCPRPKLLLKPSYFLRVFSPKGTMWVEGVIFGWGQYDVTTINSTTARNKQSIFVLLSHHQKCTLISEITGLYFSWIVDKNRKNTSQFQLEAGSPIHLLA